MNLQKLQQQRNAYRQLIDRFLEEIESVTIDQNIQEFVTRLECLELKVSQLQTLSDKVLTQVDSDGFEEEFFSTENYSLSLNIRMAKLRDVRNHLQSASSSGILSQTPSSGEQQQQQQIALQQNGNAVRSADTSSQFYRLPKLSLPTFDGDVLKWQSFWDSFECTIHANPSLTDVQKFAYLQSQLEGNAARVIAGFALTNVNYTRAVELLQERYGQTHKITHASMQALLSLPKPSSRVDSLRLFYDSLETHIRSLEARGDNQDTFGTLLVPIILDKLPSEMRQNLARVNGDNDWKLQFLRTALNKEIKILEAGETTRTQEIQHSDATALFHAGARPKNKPLYQSKETRYTNTDKKQLEIKCALCANGHKSNDCSVYPDTASRLEIVKQKRLCFNCLGNHQVAKCNSIKRCQICKRKHHTAICNSKTSQGSSDSQNTENRKTERHFQNTEHHNPERPNSMVMHSSSSFQDNVLLKTAIATVSSDSVQADASILFDEGSQKSFITEKLARELALNRGTSETIHLSAFGSTSEKTIHVDTATVHIETTQRKKIPIKVLIVPTIGTPIDIRMQKSASNLSYLRDLKLAHPVTEQCAFNISMLIGADSYWTIVEDHVVRGDGPTAVRSKIGYLLSGPIRDKDEKTSNHVFNVMTSHNPATLHSLGVAQSEQGESSGGLPWRYCPTDDNPADLLTRGIRADDLLASQLWDTGPTWLTHRTQWPIWEYNQTHAAQDDEAETSTPTNPTPPITVSSLQCTDTLGVHNIVDVTRHGTYSKLLRVTAYVSRFVVNCRRQRPGRLTGSLSSNELQDAEMRWLTSCQSTNFRNEIDNLHSKERRLPLVRQLRLYLDSQGHIRCGGRIHNAPVEELVKFPYLLPGKHALTKLIIEDAHRDQLHAGIAQTVTHLRQKFWIPSIRQRVKTVLRKCVMCRKVTGKPYSAPDPPPLPATRVSDEPPFSVTGVDFSGALHVKEKTGKEHKVYICLFTCASTRAVHIEIVPDLTEESFMLAFRRFVSRRSLPKRMISDNASTYQAAADQIRRLCASPTIQTALAQRGTEWQFIPKRAPWYGGWWERLIGVTKTTMKKILGRAFIDLQSLQTIVTEVEAMMNDRPLTYVSSSRDDPEPLTPSHLLFGRRLTNLPHINTDSSTSSGIHRRADAQQRLKRHTQLLDQYWRRWKHEYLTSLREFHRASGVKNETIRVGDVVVVHEDFQPRLQWSLAVVERLLTGNDGHTRAACIRTQNGLTTRPIVKLYPLEVSYEGNDVC